MLSIGSTDNRKWWRSLTLPRAAFGARAGDV